LGGKPVSISSRLDEVLKRDIWWLQETMAFSPHIRRQVCNFRLPLFFEQREISWAMSVIWIRSIVKSVMCKGKTVNSPYINKLVICFEIHFKFWIFMFKCIDNSSNVKLLVVKHRYLILFFYSACCLFPVLQSIHPTVLRDTNACAQVGIGLLALFCVLENGLRLLALPYYLEFAYIFVCAYCCLPEVRVERRRGCVRGPERLYYARDRKA